MSMLSRDSMTSYSWRHNIHSRRIRTFKHKFMENAALKHERIRFTATGEEAFGVTLPPSENCE